MGNFLAVTAFRDVAVERVGAVLKQYMQRHGVAAQILPLQGSVGESDALIHPEVNGWVVVLWPSYFNVHDFPLTRAIASEQGWLVSSLHVYDDDYWEHLALAGEEQLHGFCSRPAFWIDEGEELPWQATDSEPSKLSARLGVDARALEPYLVDVDQLEDPETRAHEDDEFDLSDTWVMVDFWRRLGIVYPDPPGAGATVLRLGRFAERLPAD